MAVILASKLQFYDYKNTYIIDSNICKYVCNGICCVKSLPQIVVSSTNSSSS